MSRIGLSAIVLFVLFVACSEPAPTTELPSEELVERVVENNPTADRYEGETDCAPILRQYQSYLAIYRGQEMTEQLENNVLTLMSRWIDSDDPPTREQIRDLVAHCQEQVAQ